MENATDALKMAFAVFIFVIAIAITVNVFGVIRNTSDVVTKASDKTNFYEYVDENGDSKGERIVGVETIIPMLYRYTNEALSIIIKDRNDNIIQVFDLTVEASLKNYPSYKKSYENSVKDINKDLTPWVGNPDYIRKRVELFIGGTRKKNTTDKTINGTEMKYEGFLDKYKNIKFKESFREKQIVDYEDYDEELTGGASAVSKITIVYEQI